MKKVVMLIITLILINPITVFGYEDKAYKISIPDTYQKDEKSNTWTKEDDKKSTTIIIEVENNSSNIDFSEYTNDKITKNKYLDQLKSSFVKLKDNVNISASNIEVVDINGFNAIKVNVNSSFKVEDKYDSSIYQTQYILASQNYIYYIIISSSDADNLNSTEIDSMVKSLQIKDELPKKDDSLTKYYLTLAIILSLGVLVLVCSRRKKWFFLFFDKKIKIQWL